LHQACDSGENFLNSPDSAVTVIKLQSALIPLGQNAVPTGADVMLVSTANPKISHAEKIKQCTHDCLTLEKMELRRKYPSEAVAHRNMLQRAKPHVSVRFRKFADFLSEVGPKPFPGATLDRIDNTYPEYAPGKVRWADAHTQSNNRSNSRLFDDADGNQYTVAELAKRQGVSPSAIHQRLRRGWSYAEIVADERSTPGPSSPASPPPKIVDETENPSIFVTVPDLKPIWLKAMDASYPGEWHDLSTRDKKGLRNIAERCADGLRFYAEDVVRCAIKNWSRFSARSKTEEGAYGIPNKPTVDFLEKHIRVAVNLFLEENNLEFRNFVVRPREKPCAPNKTIEAQVAPAPAPQRVFRDIPYEPPAFIYEPKEWQVLTVEEKEKFAKGYEKRLEPYNREYMARTGKLPPPEYHCPLNVEVLLSYSYPPGWEDEFCS
jgi:hypothetical protein